MSLLVLLVLASAAPKGTPMTTPKGYTRFAMPHPGRATPGTSGADRCEFLWPMPEGFEALFDCGSKGVFMAQGPSLVAVGEPRASIVRATWNDLRDGRVLLFGQRRFRLRGSTIERSTEPGAWTVDRELPQAFVNLAMWDRGLAFDYWLVSSAGEVWTMLNGEAKPRRVLDVAAAKALHGAVHVDTVNAWTVPLGGGTALAIHTSYHGFHPTLMDGERTKAIVLPPAPPDPPTNGPPGGLAAPKWPQIVRVGYRVLIARDRDLLEIQRDGSVVPWTLPENAGFAASAVSASERNDKIALVGRVDGGAAVLLCEGYLCKRLPLPSAHTPIAVHFEPSQNGLLVFDQDGVAHVDAEAQLRALRALPPGAKDRLVGNWEAHGSVGSGANTIGWMKRYELRADGTYRFSAYPQLEHAGTWDVVADELTLMAKGSPPGVIAADFTTDGNVVLGGITFKKVER